MIQNRMVEKLRDISFVLLAVSDGKIPHLLNSSAWEIQSLNIYGHIHGDINRSTNSIMLWNPYSAMESIEFLKLIVFWSRHTIFEHKYTHNNLCSGLGLVQRRQDSAIEIKKYIYSVDWKSQRIFRYQSIRIST